MADNCNLDLCKADYEARTEDEKLVNKEIGNRRELSHIYNLKRIDFENTPEYFNYQEEIEDVVYDKTYTSDKAGVEARIQQFKKKHGKKIAVNAAELANQAALGMAGTGESGYVVAGGGARVHHQAQPKNDD